MRRTSHIFDGKALYNEQTGFQICDITDPLLKMLLSDDASIRDEYDVRYVLKHMSVS